MIHPLVDPLVTSRLGRDQLVARAVLHFTSGAEVAGYDLGLGAGITGAILVAGRYFEFDAADLTSAADGIAVVVDATGRRFKAADPGEIGAVESTTVTVPPVLDATTWGRSWLVPAAPTGAWVGHADDIAVSTARGWVFVPPRVGRIIHDRATDRHWTYRVSGTWVAGLGSPSAGAVRPDALEFPLGLVVQSRTVSAPPIGSTRAAYIVPAGATGAWSAHVGTIAVGSDAGWSFITPPGGVDVFVVAEARKVRWIGGGWSADADALSSVRRGANDGPIGAGGSYTYSATAPTTGNTVADGLALTHAARAAGNILRVRYQAVITAAGPVPICLFIDATAVAAQWLPIGGAVATGTLTSLASAEFMVTIADASAHTYQIRLGAGLTGASKRSLTLQEVVVL